MSTIRCGYPGCGLPAACLDSYGGLPICAEHKAEQLAELAECEACGEPARLALVHGAGRLCLICAADHPLTIERARADMNEEG